MRVPRHPYGVQPLGNALFAGDDDRTRVPIQEIVGDDVFLQILGCLDGKSLVRCSNVCRGWYVFANHFDLWRTLTLERFFGNFRFRESWRQTFADTLVVEGGGSLDDVVVHRPIAIGGIYSDVLHKAWACASVELEDELYEEVKETMSGLESLKVESGARMVPPIGIPHVDAKEMTLERFIREFEEPNLPVIIDGLVDSWPGWKLDELEAEPLGNTEVIAGGFRLKLKDFLRYAREEGVDDQPLYVFDKDLLGKDGFSERYSRPELFGNDLFDLLASDGMLRPHFRWLILGGRRSGSSFHKDPNSTSAWNGVGFGRKRWFLYPPNESPPGVHASRDGAEVVQPLSLMEWVLDYWPLTRSRGCTCRCVEGVCGPGSVMFVPSGWWHMALNLDPMVLAVTQNYVPASRLDTVLKFLRCRPDQVSGVPPHLAHRLHDTFVQRLAAHHAHHLIAANYIQDEDGKFRPKFQRKSWAQITGKQAARVTMHEDEDGDQLHPPTVHHHQPSTTPKPAKKTSSPSTTFGKPKTKLW